MHLCFGNPGDTILGKDLSNTNKIQWSCKFYFTQDRNEMIDFFQEYGKTLLKEKEAQEILASIQPALAIFWQSWQFYLEAIC
jgi:hypothetical protein